MQGREEVCCGINAVHLPHGVIKQTRAFHNRPGVCGGQEEEEQKCNDLTQQVGAQEPESPVLVVAYDINGSKIPIGEGHVIKDDGPGQKWGRKIQAAFKIIVVEVAGNQLGTAVNQGIRYHQGNQRNNGIGGEVSFQKFDNGFKNIQEPPFLRRI